jgi:mitochondrial fission protein ELM1
MAGLTTEAEKRIWLVIGDKPGDNAQVEIIAEALGLPFEIRRVLPKEQYVLGKPPFKASLYHLDLHRSDKLEPPWPDFVLTIGRRPTMAALWIQEQSGGQTRIILLGRPKKWIERFELVIVPSQYQLPERFNVLNYDLPLMRSNDAAVAEAIKHWQETFDALDKPVTALLVGGQTKPFRFDKAAAQELLDKTSTVLSHSPGTLYITTSRRTPPEVVDTLREQLPEYAILHRWDPDNKADNPYLALLGLADQFIVTGDSISMMVEVARRGKPLAIYELPYQKDPATRLRRLLTDIGRRETGAARSGKAYPRLMALLQKTRLAGYPRDLTAIHALLYQHKLAVPLGTPFLRGGPRAVDELPQVVERIRRVVLQGQPGVN